MAKGYRLIVDRGRMTQRMLSLKDHTFEQAKEAAQGMVFETNALTAEVIDRADGQTVATFKKPKE